MPPLDEENKPLNLGRPQRARDAFIEYSNAERQRRQDSGISFDPRIFDEAVELIVRKLKKFETEGRA